MYQEKVKAYYDYTLRPYEIFWHGDTQAVHYGIWDASTKNLRDALLNTNRFLAEKGGIKASSEVLDAGCGVGGSAFWIAKNIGAHVTGITISKKQLAKAEELAKKLDLQKNTEFFLQDYTKTSFLDASFDIVWAIESVCHAVNKEILLKEFYRLLKPGGKLVIADGFVERAPKSKKEIVKLQNFLKGMTLDNLAEQTVFEQSLYSVGFKNIHNIDKTEAIMPTAAKMIRMSSWSWPLSIITSWLGLTPHLLVDNNRAGIDQYFLFKERILTYRVFIAEKQS